MAYIRKRMGKYQCVVRVSGYPTITKTFEHHKDAERFGKDLELKLFRGEYDLEKKSSLHSKTLLIDTKMRSYLKNDLQKWRAS